MENPKDRATLGITKITQKLFNDLRKKYPGAEQTDDFWVHVTTMIANDQLEKDSSILLNFSRIKDTADFKKMQESA